MSLFHGYNEIPKSDNLMAMSISSPCKTTVFKPKESNQKSKGLSIRSNSNMNGFHSTHPTNVKEKRETYSQVLEKSQRRSFNCISKYRNVEFEGLTPKGEKGIMDKNKKTERILDNKTFKKPLLPKRSVSKRSVKLIEPKHLARISDVFVVEKRLAAIQMIQDFQMGRIGRIRKKDATVNLNTYQNVEFEGLTPKKEKGIIDKKEETEGILDSKIFKKPQLPKRFVKRVREPTFINNFPELLSESERRLAMRIRYFGLFHEDPSESELIESDF